MKTYLPPLMLAFLILLIACTGQEKSAPTASIAAPTQIPESTATRTRTPEPTRTPLPSYTATAQPTSTTSPSPTVTAAPSATYHPEIVKYIGLPDDSLPEGVEFWGASVLDFVDGNSIGYSITFVRDGVRFLLLVSFERRVTDVLIFPQLGADHIITTNYCMRNKQEDPYIVTISRMDLETTRTRFLPNENIVQAWRIDPGSGRYEAISTEGIECSAEGGFDPNYVTYKYLKQLSP